MKDHIMIHKCVKCGRNVEIPQDLRAEYKGDKYYYSYCLICSPEMPEDTEADLIKYLDNNHE